MSLPQNVDPSKTNYRADSDISRSTTWCTTLTGAGRSAIAVISVRGAEANAIVSRCFQGTSKSPFARNEIRYGVWTGPDTESTAGESIVITPLGAEHVEIHCHGGPAATARIIDDLKICGAAPMDSDRWYRDTEMLPIREAQQVLARCLTARTAAIAMDQFRGAMVHWATKVLKTLEQESLSIAGAKRQAEQLLGPAEFTTRLAEPFRVVLFGPPNVGKSSLLNAIVGFDRSITLHAAGTTRDVLHADTVIDGLPIRLSDTAGIRDSDQAIEQQGMAQARIAAVDADLVLVITEPGRARDPGPAQELLGCSKPLIRVMNKSDLLKHLGKHDAYEILTNALTGDGVKELMEAIADRLTAKIPKPGAPAAINNRQACLLREISMAGSRGHIENKLRELLGVGDAGE